MKKLNLGCGQFKKEGFVNIDFSPRTNPDVLHNLDQFPYPFDHDEFDLIEADHILEHLKNPFCAMKEIHRLLKNGASLIIRVPHFSRGFTHPEHKRGFDVTFPFYFNASFKGGYQGIEFKIRKIKLSWFAQKYLKKETVSGFIYYTAFIMNIPISFFANLSPVLCSRLWCFWVGGFEEIEFHFICKK